MNWAKSNKILFSIILVISFVIAEFFLIKFLDLKIYDHVMMFLFLAVAIVSLNTNLIIGLISSFILVLVYGLLVIIGGTTDYMVNIGMSYYYLGIPVIIGLLFGLIGNLNQNYLSTPETFELNFDELVRIDELTGFRNLEDYNLSLEEEISRVKMYGGEISLMLINIDSFAELNQAYGFTQGNKFLKCFSDFVVELTENVDKLYRISSDRFAIILPNTNEDGSVMLKERLIKKIEEMDVFKKSNTQKNEINVEIEFSEFKDFDMDAKTFNHEVENKFEKYRERLL